MREFSNIDYILGSPDSFIENQILWTLTQNPSLGTPEDYSVADDIIGNGTIDYFNSPYLVEGYEESNCNPLYVDVDGLLYILDNSELYIKQSA